MNLQDILQQMKQQIHALNDQINSQQVILDDLRSQKQALMADRDALQTYIASLP